MEPTMKTALLQIGSENMKTKTMNNKIMETKNMKQKGFGIVGGRKRISHIALFSALALILVLVSSGVVSVAPVITSWSSAGGNPLNKDNATDIMYLVQQGDNITFSATINESANFTWQINKEEKRNISSATSDSFNFTVPNENGIWEIHLKASNADGEDHIEWVISTLNLSEAPDIFDYFTDKKVQGRTESDPWGRALPEWSSSFDVSRAFIKGSVGKNWETYIPSTIAHGTWKFRYKCGGIAFYPLYYNSGACFHWNEECGGAHHHCMIYNRARGEDFSIEYDCTSPCGPVENNWFNVTIIRTQDGWYYMFSNDILDSYVYDPFEEPWQKIVLSGGGDLSCFDGLEVYENKYLFPEREGIVYEQYIAKEIASGYYLVPTYKNGIIINGRNITLSDINSAINNASLFTYDAETKTAVCYTNLYINTGSELVIQNETLKFHCDSDGELEFAPGYGATLRIENSAITTDNEYYFVWNFAGPTTHLGYPITLYYAPPYNERYGPMTLEWAYFGRFIVKDSVIDNSGYLYIDSPYELNITNTQITNLHEVDIGDYTPCADDFTQTIRTALKGNKSFFIQTDDLNIKDFVLDNVTFTGAEKPLNITFYVNAHRDKINIYNIDLQNGNIIIENPIAQTTRQSHSCYVGGSSNVWGEVYRWKSYITSEIGLVNCRFNGIIITPDVHTDKTGRNVNKSALVKYYLDVKVVDANGEPVSDANVTVSCEQSWTEEDRKTNHYPVENIETAHPYATGKYRCVYHHYRVVEGLPLSSTLTGTDGHTPLPSDKANTLVVTDYKKYLNTGTGEVKQDNFTYSITASKDGKTASMSGWDIDESWYREDPNTPTKTVVCNIDTGECWVEGVATNLSITNWSSTGGNPTYKDNPQDLIYKVQPEDTITFTVTANENCNFTWKVMLGANTTQTYTKNNTKTSSFTWQVPNEASTWDIEVETSNYKPVLGPYEQDHKIWTITTSELIELYPGEDIQSAIDSLPEEGGVVELKEGTWHLNNSMTPIVIDRSEITLRGQGKNKTTLSHTEHIYHSTIRISVYRDDQAFIDGTKGEPKSCGALEPQADELCNISNVVIEDIHIHGFDREFSSYFDNVAIEGLFFKNAKFSDLWIDNIGVGCELWKSVNSIFQYSLMEHTGGAFWDFGPFCGYTIHHNIFRNGGNGYVIKYNGGCDHNIFTNNIIEHVTGWALQPYGASSHNIITNNIIRYPSGYGIWMWGFDNLVKGNIIHDCGIDGIRIYDSWAFGNPSENINNIANNLIYNNAESGIATQVRATMNTVTRTANIINNVIYGNEKDGITCDGILRDTNPPANGTPVYAYNIKNNIITDNKEYGINYIGGKSINLSHNDVYNNSLGNYNGISSGEGDISADPLFADPDNGDFHLKSQYGRWGPNQEQWVHDSVTSPCIDVGDPADDYSNEPDYPNGRINLGAYGNTWEASLGILLTTGTLKGKVIDGDTSLPIEGALIEANSHQTTTNSTGNYIITLPTGNYTVTASKTGYQSQSKSAEVFENRTTEVNFTLTVATTTTSTTTSTTTTTSTSTTTTTTTSISTTSTTTTLGTTTTTTIWPCDLPGDYPPCGEVTLEEVVDFINLWAQGEADLEDVVNLINAWAEGPVCELPGDYPPCGEITLEEVVDFINLWSLGQADLGDVVNLINAWAGS